MYYEELKKQLDNNKLLKLKIYSLIYIIEIKDNNFYIYPEIYPKRKSMYKTFDELMNNYTIYNEALIYNLDRIIIMN